MKRLALTLVMIAAAGTCHAQAQQPQTAVKKPVVDPDKVRCKTKTEIGSLAKTSKECHTNAEWRQLAEQGRANAEEYRNVMNSSRSN